MNIAAWLRSLGLERYEQAFAANEVDAHVLASLTADDLKEIGVEAVGHRRKLLDAIAALRTQAPPPDRAAPASEAERRYLTVMFIDLVDSTRMSAELDPEDMRAVIIAYQNSVATEISRVEGNVAKYMGDGVLAYFGWPKAHENESERAVRAGLAILAAVARLKERNGKPLSARVGVATGLVVVGDLIGEGAAQEQAVVGETPNLAARLQSTARPGQMVVSEETKRLIDGMFEVEDLGRHDLKGIAGARGVFLIVGERALETRFAARAGQGLATLIGREQELALLTQRWRQSVAGEGQLMLLSGEAGIGKSRLTEALVEAVAAEPHHRIRYQCSPYHTGSALYPVITQLSFAARIQPGDAQGERLAKLAAALDHLPSDEAMLLSTLFGGVADGLALSPAQQRFRTLQAVIHHVIAQSRDKPVLFIVEDAHWIDPSTRELIDEAIATFAAARVFLLITSRPGLQHNFAGRTAFTQLVLSRLSRANIAGIIETASRNAPLPAAIIDEIAARSDGVPLYIEEMAKAAIDAGALALGGAIAVPASLQDSLMSRLDRLQPVKEVAQTASVIGRTFEYRTLAAISPLPSAELIEALDKLTEAELIFRSGNPPDAQYIFKHALLRDAAYETLLKSKRQVLHQRLHAALQSNGEAAPEVLALHAQSGGLTQAAIAHWRAAGEAAMARPAYEEATNHFANAVALAATLPDARELELELRTHQGLAAISAKGHSHPDTCAIFERALTIAGTLDRPDLSFVSWYGLWCGHHVRSEVTLAQRSAKALFDAAQAIDNSSHRMMGARARAITAVMSGDLAEGLRWHEEAAKLQHPERDRAFAKVVGQDQSVSFRSYYSINLWALGRTEDACRLADESIALSKETGHVNSLGYAYMHATIVALCANRPIFPELTEEMIAFSTEHRMQMWREFGHQFRAIHQLGDGNMSALADLTSARKALRARNANLFSSLLALAAADRLLTHGRGSEADALIAEASTTIDASGERFALAEKGRINGRRRLPQS